MTRVITFDVFGTLLEFPPDCPWAGKYVKAVQEVNRGDEPYRPLTAIFAEIGADWRSLTVRPGVVEALARLKRRFTIAPLSNADSVMAKGVAEHFGLPWSKVIRTELAGCFKPRPNFYEAALVELNSCREAVLHVAAHKFDLKAAKGQGLRTGYVAWPGYAEAIEPFEFDCQATSLGALCDSLGV